MLLQFVFRARFTQELPSAPHAGGNTNTHSAGGQHQAAPRNTHANPRTNPVELRSRCCRARQRSYCSARGCRTEGRNKAGDTADRHCAAEFANNRVHQNPAAPVRCLLDCRNDLRENLLQMFERRRSRFFAPTESVSIFSCPSLYLIGVRQVRMCPILLRTPPLQRAVSMRRSRFECCSTFYRDQLELRQLPKSQKISSSTEYVTLTRYHMPTSRETILTALHARLSALPATALRGEVLPERVPAAGLLILRDGEPGEPEVTLSPLSYHYQHRAEIEAVVQGATRDATFDALGASIGTALAADRTLGGLCDWVEAEAPRPVDLPVEGAASLKAAVIPVILHYSTADPLS